MTRFPLFLLAAVTSVGLAACSQAESASDEMGEAPAALTRADVDAVRDAFLDGMETKDVDALLATYTPDAEIHEADGSVIQGRDAIRQSLTEQVNTMSDFSLTPERTETGTTLAWETGRFAATATSPDGQPMPVSGSYLVVLKRGDDGQLRLVQDATWPDQPMGQEGSGM